MLARRLLLGLPALLAWRQVRAAPPGAVQWVSSNLPPYIWFGPNGPEGYGYELVQLMAAKLGRTAEIAAYPWIRALRMTREGDAYAMFPMGRTPEREAHYRWLIKLGHVRYTFFTTASSSLDVNNISALLPARVGVLRGSTGLHQLQDQGFKTLVETQDYKDLVRHLATRLVDAIYGADTLIYGSIAEFTRKPEEYRAGLTLDESDLYIGASLKLDDAEAERWQRAYRELQADGSVARLLKKYPHVR